MWNSKDWWGNLSVLTQWYVYKYNLANNTWNWYIKFTDACFEQPMMLQTSPSYGPQYSWIGALELDDCDHHTHANPNPQTANYWLLPNFVANQGITLDFGCTKRVYSIDIRNTNNHFGDRYSVDILWIQLLMYILYMVNIFIQRHKGVFTWEVNRWNHLYRVPQWNTRRSQQSWLQCACGASVSGLWGQVCSFHGRKFLWTWSRSQLLLCQHRR